MKIRVRVRVSESVVRGALVAAMLAVPGGDLCSESVALQTYYPAPSGAYTQIITTQGAFLARDPTPLGVGTSLGIGTAIVQDTTLKLAVLGNVGINRRDPAARLDINGNGGTNIDFIANGRLITGDSNNVGAIWFNSTNAAASGKLGMNGSSAFGLYNGAITGTRVAWPLSVSAVSGNGNVGINTAPSAYTLDVNGPIAIRDTTCTNGNIVQYSLLGPNTTIGYVTTPNATCPANTYATWANGLMTNYQHENPLPALQFQTGAMLCCPCPFNNCIAAMP